MQAALHFPIPSLEIERWDKGGIFFDSPSCLLPLPYFYNAVNRKGTTQ